MDWESVFKNPKEYNFEKIISENDMTLEIFNKLCDIYSHNFDNSKDCKMLWSNLLKNKKIDHNKFLNEYMNGMFYNIIDKDMYLEHQYILRNDIYDISSREWFDIDLIKKCMYSNLDWKSIFLNKKVDINSFNIETFIELYYVYKENRMKGFSLFTLSYIHNITIDFILSFGEENLNNWDWDYILDIDNKNSFIIIKDFEKLPKKTLIYILQYFRKSRDEIIMEYNMDINPFN